MKRIIISILLIFISILSISCNLNNIFSHENENGLVIQINDTEYYQVDYYKIKDCTNKIGKVTIDKRVYNVYTNTTDNDYKFLYARKASIFRDKELCIFVREDITLPKITELVNYKVYYQDKEYNFDIPKLYTTDSDLELNGSCTLYYYSIELDEYPEIYYELSVYLYDGKYYIKNHDNKFVELIETN